MDLVAACRAFVSVGERGGFTAGAAAVRMSQSVASRRVAALERHLGEALFARSTRRARLTRFGQDMLPAARRLVTAADDLDYEAEAARRHAFRLALPDTCATGEIAVLLAEARRQGIELDVRVGPPRQRTAFAQTREVRAAITAAPPDSANWRVPLGLASARDRDTTRIYLETLRPRRNDTSPPPRVWLQPEDDVPHVRDRMRRLCESVGLFPAQLDVATDLAAATARVLAADDLLLCSRAQAEELGLRWWHIGEIALARGFSVTAADSGDADRIAGISHSIGHCLGVPPQRMDV